MSDPAPPVITDVVEQPPVVDRQVVGTALAAVLLLCLSSMMLLVRLAEQPTATGPKITVPALGEVPAGEVAPSPIDEQAAAAARAAAGCQVLVDGEPFEDRTHVDPLSAPPAAALYPEHRPAHSGRHYPQRLALPDRVPTRPIDERAVVHNLEHGSVVVWFDAEQVDVDTIGVMQEWMRQRRALGFESDADGGIFVSPAEVIDSGSAIAVRAWGVAMDCDRFDLTVVDAFLADHWGSHGRSPEASLSPFPEGALGRGTSV